MLSELLLHPKTATASMSLVSKPPHGILITGVHGSGKLTLAMALVSEILAVQNQLITTHPYVKYINPDSDSISIEDIRSLQLFLKLKVPDSSKNEIKRAIIISHAERMRHEAQNALLKTLEEPPLDTLIILTSNSARQLLPTITSRLTGIEIMPVSENSALDYFSGEGYKESEIKKYYPLSLGHPALLKSLLIKENTDLTNAVELAKQILTEPLGNRLMRIDELASNKVQVKTLLDALQRIAHAALSSASVNNKTASVKTWHYKQATIINTITLLPNNPNMKLLLNDLFLNI
jgi:predicted AAA+ superfamily ATPase